MCVYSTIHCATLTPLKTFANILSTLAASPEHLAPLREEIESVTREHGWTKSSMAEMVKLDSFIKECARFYNILACPPLMLPSRMIP